MVDIEWRVHLANRKASFYSFYGQFGADDTFVGRSKLAPTNLIKPAGDDPQSANLRNATVALKDRASQLETDPGEQVISHTNPGDVELSNQNGTIPIASLGTLRLDANGRLIVLGGYGQSNFRPNPPASPDLNDYANNDNWFDDAGDGSVKARIRLSNGDTIDADPAWVMVGPPDFAPGIGNVVTLFDTAWDVAVREPVCPAPALKQILHSLKAESALSACEPCFGIVSDWGRNDPVLKPGMISPFGHAWFVHRSRFDACLQQLARNRGAAWIKAEAQGVNLSAKDVRVETTAEPIIARWMVIANGSPSWAANISRQQPANIDSLIAFWAQLPATMEERLLRVETTDFGWWYICPADGTGAFACFVTDAPGARTTGVAQVASWNERFRATNLFQQLGGAATASTINIISASTASLPLKHGHSWIVVGDAAAKLDPLGSSGTITALGSGQRAANAVADAIKRDFAGVDEYERWNNGLLDVFTRQREQHYAVEAQKRGDGFWTRRTK